MTHNYMYSACTVHVHVQCMYMYLSFFIPERKPKMNPISFLTFRDQSTNHKYPVIHKPVEHGNMNGMDLMDRVNLLPWQQP